MLGHVDGDGGAMVFGLGNMGFSQTIEQLCQIEIVGFPLHVAMVQTRQVQNVIHQTQQVFAGVLHVLQLPKLVLIELVLQHEFIDAHDGVQGRAYFVAHDGQKLSLGTLGLFCAGLRSLQVGDVCAVDVNVFFERSGRM